MSHLIGLSSSRSSPGASSLAVGLAWAFARRSIDPLVIEADPAGGVLSQRFALPPDPSLMTLVRESADGLTEEILSRHVVAASGVRYVLGPVDPTLAARAVDRFGRILNLTAFRPQASTVVDMGRWSANNEWKQIARAVDQVLIVTGLRLEDVQSARFAVALCNDLRIRAGLVVVGDRPFSPADVAETLGVPLMAGIVYDPQTAGALVGGSFSAGPYRRSLLGRSIDDLASRILGSS